MSNQLKNTSSPYLLQHAENPVNWYPWCEEAFERAKSEDKPIFLSIGYSTCHWCHVMAYEHFHDMGQKAIFCRHIFSAEVALWNARISRFAERHCKSVEQ